MSREQQNADADNRMARMLREQSASQKRIREASTFEVFDRSSSTDVQSHGVFDTIEEARGCVMFDGLHDYEIWQGDHIVEESEHDRYLDGRLTCYGSDDPQAHPADSLRTIEYRAAASLEWVTKSLCDGCIADLRHAGMEIKGEEEEVIGGPGWRNGEPPRPIGQISHDAEKLVAWVTDTAFACGARTDEEDESYETVFQESEQAKAKLVEFIAELESRAGVGVADATGVPR